MTRRWRSADELSCQPFIPPFNSLFLTTMLLRCTRTLLLLRQAGGTARSGLLSRSPGQLWSSSARPPVSNGRPMAASAAAVTDMPETHSHPAPAAAPAYRAFIDFKFVRDNVDAVAANCRDRLSNADPHLVAQLYDEFVRAQQETDKLRAARNENSSAMKVRRRRVVAAAAGRSGGGLLAMCCYVTSRLTSAL